MAEAVKKARIRGSWVKVVVFVVVMSGCVGGDQGRFRGRGR